MQPTSSEEREAFRRLFEMAYRPLLAYALRRSDDHAAAEEVVGETLLVAWKRRRDMPTGADTLPWLYGVARRVLANQRRAAQRRRRLERAMAPLTRPSVDPDETANLAAATR